MDNNQLTHHGIKGMKWGIRRTPAQLGHDDPAKPKKKKKSGNVFTRAKRKRQRLKNLEKAREAKKTKEEFEAEKKKAIESGTAQDVLKFKGKLTNMELSTAVNRLNMEAQLSQINSRTVKTGMDKAESIMSKVDRVRGMAEKGISAYNTFAKVYNSLSPDDIPTLDGNYKDRREAREEKARKKAEEAQAKKIKKLIETGSLSDIANEWSTLSIDQRSLVNKRVREDKTFNRALEDAAKISITSEPEPVSASTPKRRAVRHVPERYYVTAGQEIVSEILKGLRS